MLNNKKNAASEELCSCSDPNGNSPASIDTACTVCSFQQECPDENFCFTCWDKGFEVEGTNDNGICEECEFERQVGRADALMDLMKENEE